MKNFIKIYIFTFILSYTQLSGVQDNNLDTSKEFTKMYASIKGNFLIQDYFYDSEFWIYSPPDAMDDWHFCISRLQTKTDVFARTIFIGTGAGALIDELCHGDYEVKSNEYYAQHNNSLHLLLKEESNIEKWRQISTNEFGLEHEKVPFTRVISVVKNAEAEATLRATLQGTEADCQYSLVKEHVFVQLIDHPKDEHGQQEQLRQWKDLKTNFSAIFSTIDRAIEEKEPILVHCTAGRHRSAAIVIAYLVARLGLPVRESFDYIRSKRGCVNDYERSEFAGWLSEWAQE